MVIAFIALRKCELRIVQSSLLVFGLCTFAGGLRWKEQWFNPAAIQIQSSLLSISVSTVLLPAVFHFSLRTDQSVPSESTDLAPIVDSDHQKTSILRMSHGVAWSTCLFQLSYLTFSQVYAAYLTFQLYSHSHLYEDAAAGIHSREYSKKSPKKKKIKGKEPASPVLQPGALPTGDLDVLEPPPRRSQSPSSPPPSSSSAPDLSNINSLRGLPPQNTVRLVDPGPRGSLTPGIPMQRFESTASDRSDVTLTEGEEHPNPFGQEEATPGATDDKEVDIPQLSWFMTVFILAVVSVLVAISADWLVATANGISVTKYIGKEWTALILLPTVRAIADCVTAVNVSVKDQLTLSSAVAIGSTIQLSLFVIPLIVIVAWITGFPLGLLFDPFESVALYLAIHTMNYVVADGQSNWMEGLILICFYVIIAITFWFYPGGSVSCCLELDDL
ncbi:hypothetical protein BDM02DRAFT_3155964 [Thelephora ganbajun]|uniref:Uncharacterized protein n=1 Tax=Thelephora ganbajun TaxID=370292 RepID=A0ACB6ZE83_THEGA|nr:hypothetical protein BDM02DRAFT_3155964 [Thelephora ganbajun]